MDFVKILKMVERIELWFASEYTNEGEERLFWGTLSDN